MQATLPLALALSSVNPRMFVVEDIDSKRFSKGFPKTVSWYVSTVSMWQLNNVVIKLRCPGE